jgi:hypothetical protein
MVSPDWCENQEYVLTAIWGDYKQEGLRNGMQAETSMPQMGEAAICKDGPEKSAGRQSGLILRLFNIFY